MKKVCVAIVGSRHIQVEHTVCRLCN